MRKFDLIVVGGGSGGLAAAQRAAEYGAQVALLESGRLGGTCVNRGCVPKKIMWHAAELAREIAHASEYGFDLELKGHDWTALARRRERYIRRLNSIYANNLKRRGVHSVAGHAAFSAPRTLTVDGEILSEMDAMEWMLDVDGETENRVDLDVSFLTNGSDDDDDDDEPTLDDVDGGNDTEELENATEYGI